MSDIAVTASLGIATLLLNGAGLGFVATQVVLARRQLQHAQNVTEREVERGKKQATIDFYMSTIGQRTQWRSILPDDWDAKAIHRFIDEAFSNNDKKRLQALSDYLGYFESLAVAIAADVYDLEMLDSLNGSRIRRIAANYRPFFLKARAAGSPSLYRELEWLGQQLEAVRAGMSGYVLLADRARD